MNIGLGLEGRKCDRRGWVNPSIKTYPKFVSKPAAHADHEFCIFAPGGRRVEVFCVTEFEYVFLPCVGRAHPDHLRGVNNLARGSWQFTQFPRHEKSVQRVLFGRFLNLL